MIFRFLLWILAWRMRWLARHNDDFQQAIAGRDCVLQFTTMDGQVNRYYAFANGSVTSRGVAHTEPSMTFAFRDARLARELIMTMAKNPKNPSVFMTAMQQGNVRIEGDMSLMMWFMQLARYFGPQKKKAE